ncbi:MULTISPECIES: hypothetical protein [Cohnella]|uniref:DNA-binding protein n=1 Tax=Cohnella fermenti TaxID=2565925 RepID=A0A4V3WE90_9BACL|nr:hypothetical protein [Cohnella fermenti]THF75380.1 hypothetical protein E6C55_22305 [Cohnella fermenti]
MDVAKYQFKEVNGFILRLLLHQGFDYTNDRIVDAYLKERQISCVLRSVQDHFLYLAGKGKEYIEVKHIQIDENQMAAKLTPRGVDLLYGVIDDDPGISIDH